MANRFTKVAAAVVAPALLAFAFFGSTPAPAQTGTEVQPGDPAAYYKAKCVACHGAKADKKFDAAMPEAQMVDAVLTGMKVEKPPHMPAYEPKGVTAPQAKALVDHMKQLKSTQ